MSNANLPEGAAAKTTIFISHASEDDLFVNWLGWQIKALGHPVEIDHWSFKSHQDFIEQMYTPAARGATLLAVISPHYLGSDYCNNEWKVFHHDDPGRKKGTIVVARIAAVAPPPPLNLLPHQDFFGTRDEDELLRRLRVLLGHETGAPKTKPPLPELSATSAPAAPTAAAASPAARLLEAYLVRVVRETEFLRLDLIDQSTATESASERLGLAGVYTRLEVHGAEDGDRLEKMMREGREPQRRSALAEAGHHPRLVVLGPPGSGKSTFADMLALCLAGERLQRPEANLAKLGDDWTLGPLLPVRITLREFAAQPVRPTLWEFCAKGWRDTLPGLAAVIAQHFAEYGGIFLLDGLDEVPEAEGIRQRVKDAVLALGKEFPKARLLLTSRTYAYQKQEWRLPGFAETVLAPFSEEQWEEFIAHWYGHLAEVRAGFTPAAAEGQAARLREAIASRPHLRDLAERPLLLTLMASLHALRGGTLPDRRHKLYELSVELLVDLWEKPKRVWLHGVPGVFLESVSKFLETDREKFLRALERLAFAAHRDQQDLRGCADVAESALAAELMQLAGDGSRVNPVHLRDYLRDRAGILAHVAPGVYRFPHRSFQEYLAARHLCGDALFPHEPVRLVRADPERWREVFLLTGAHMAAPGGFAGWALLDELLPLPPAAVEKPADADWLAALLGAQFLVESHLAEGALAGPRQAKCDRVRGWLTRLIGEADLPVVDRAAAGDTLAQLGDPRPGVGVNVVAGKSMPDFAWCEVPAGPFPMGNDKAHDADADDDEQPRWMCGLIVEPYRIARYPVTVAQFAVFIEAGGYAERRWWSDESWAWREKENIAAPDDNGAKFEVPNHPRVGVSWFEAEAFCRWASDALGTAIFLPSEAQWERAARGMDARKFSWGNEAISPKFTNFADTGLGCTSAVGIFAPGVSPAGLHDASGNVWEWCATPWVGNYQDYVSALAKLSGSEATASRVVRGGSWVNRALLCRAACRGPFEPGARWDFQGFRLAAGRAQEK